MTAKPLGRSPVHGGDQLTPGQVTGPLTMAIEVPYAKVAVGFAVPFAAQNQGAIAASAWTLGMARSSATGLFSAMLGKSGGLCGAVDGYNDSFGGGVSATALVQVVSQPVYYVNASKQCPGVSLCDLANGGADHPGSGECGTVPGRWCSLSNGV